MSRLLLAVFMFAALVTTWNVGAAMAQSSTAQTANDDDGGAVEPSLRTLIRFVTTDDFPPFNAADEEGVLTGFNVGLARAICLDLSITCDIKSLPWDALLGALNDNNADAVIAAHRVSANLSRKVAFTKRYFHTPARFAVRKTAPVFATTPTGMDGRRVAVVRGSAHEAYITAFFRNAELKSYETPELARQAVRTGLADAVFDDGIGLVFWVNGTLSRACCVLRGGPFFEPRYFGDGIAILVRKTDDQMRRMLNGAIVRLQENGRLQELVDRHFPIRVY